MTMIRDFFRRRRAARHVKEHGWMFDYEGLRLRLPEGSDANVVNALLRGKYESEEIRMIRTYIPVGRPVIELGGSLGVVSAIIGSHLDAHTPHLVVEANPDLLAICFENANVPDKEQAMELLECAVSYSGPVAVFEVADNPHASGLDRGPSSSGGKTVEVAAQTLAALHAKLGAPEGFSLICDIEGGEADMMRLDHETVAKAGVVVMELHPSITPEAAAMIPPQMAQLGFDVLEQAGDVYAWRRG